METEIKRSIGVTISAVVVIIGSVFWLLAGLLTLAVQPAEANSGSPLWALLIGPLLMALCAVWGLLTAVGLLRLRRWARYSILIFSGFLAYAGLVSSLMIGFTPLPPNVPEETLPLVRAVALVFTAIPSLGIGGWWLYLFNKASVKAQFPKPVGSLDRPLSIIVIAAFMLFGAFTILLLAISGQPAVIFGYFIRGWAPISFYVLWALAGLYGGYGLLRLSETARRVAVGYATFGIINTMLFTFLPGFEDRLTVVMESVSPAVVGTSPALSPGVFILLNLQAIVIWGVALWFLITQKQAFVRTEKGTQSTP